MTRPKGNLATDQPLGLEKPLTPEELGRLRAEQRKVQLLVCSQPMPHRDMALVLEALGLLRRITDET